MKSNPKSQEKTGLMPVPDEAALKSSTEEICDTYKAEYASQDPNDLSALAAKLLARGLKKDSPARRFVFLREASDTAAQAGDPDLILRALDELGKLFAIDELPLKTAALQKGAKNVRTRDTNKALFESANALLSTVIRADDYEDAERLVKTMEIAAFKVGVPRSSLRYASIEVQRLKKKYADIKPALDKLAQEPNDAEANRLVGSFRCLEKGDWDNGLPLLVKGDDAQLQTLAENDRAAPTTVDARVAVGDGWWMLAQQRAKGPTRANIEQRACFWYVLAMPDSLKKSRDRMEKNIRRHNNDYPSLAWGHLNIAQAKATLGALRVPKHKGIPARMSWSGPIEITALARTEKNNIRMSAGKGASVIFNWEQKPEELRITRSDGSGRRGSGSLATAIV